MGRRYTLAAVVIALLASGARSLMAAPQPSSGVLFELRPIGSNGSFEIEGQEILTRPGSEVTLELFISGWAPADLGTFAAFLDCADFSGSISGDLSPDAVLSTIDKSRLDYVFFDVPFLSACSLRPCSGVGGDTVACEGGAFLTSVPDPGEPRYAATFVVALSTDARGTFTLGIDVGPEKSVALDGSAIAIEPIKVVPVIIRTQTHFAGDIPAVSTWGTLAMSLALTIAATLALRPRSTALI